MVETKESRLAELKARQANDEQTAVSSFDLYWRGSASQMFIDDVRTGRCVKITADALKRKERNRKALASLRG